MSGNPSSFDCCIKLLYAVVDQDHSVVVHDEPVTLHRGSVFWSHQSLSTTDDEESYGEGARIAVVVGICTRTNQHQSPEHTVLEDEVSHSKRCSATQPDDPSSAIQR